MIVYSSAIGTYNDSTELLVAIHKHPVGVMVAAVLQSLSVVMLEERTRISMLLGTRVQPILRSEGRISLFRIAA